MIQRNTDGSRHGDIFAIWKKVLLSDSNKEMLRLIFDEFHIIHGGSINKEFVSDESGDNIRIAKDGFESTCGMDEDFVTNQMAHIVIDSFEIVEADKKFDEKKIVNDARTIPTTRHNIFLATADVRALGKGENDIFFMMIVQKSRDCGDTSVAP